MDILIERTYIGQEMAYFHTLMLSLFLHALVMVILWKMELPPPSSTPISIEVISPKEVGDKKQIVRQVETPEDLLLPEDNDSRSSLLSERRQRVREEMRAKESGLSANRTGGGVNIKNILNPPRKMVGTTKEHATGQAPGPSQRSSQRQESQSNSSHSASGGSGGASTLSDRLNDSVKVGAFNALNTDRFVYYSYYERINSGIHGHWEGRVRDILYQYQRQGVMPKVPKPWVTEVEVLLTPQGAFHRAILHSSSGIEIVDQACIRAFTLGSPFLNPPKEMIQKDGFIHVYYNFGVFLN